MTDEEEDRRAMEGDAATKEWKERFGIDVQRVITVKWIFNCWEYRVNGVVVARARARAINCADHAKAIAFDRGWTKANTRIEVQT